MQKFLTSGRIKQVLADDSLKNIELPSSSVGQKKIIHPTDSEYDPDRHESRFIKNHFSDKIESIVPFMSVVIPAYNAENTIWHCIRTLNAALCQIEHDIIVVDDASTDNTAAVVQKLAGIYGNVSLIRQKKNQGPGPARNCGLKNASGEFVWFVDADDEIPIENFQNFDIRQACENRDVVMFRYNQVIPGKKGIQPWGKYNAMVMAARPSDNFTVNEFPSVLTTFNATWNKFFRRESVIFAGMDFPNIIVSEDLPFIIANLCAAKNIHFVDRELYTYRTDASNISRIVDQRRLQSLWSLKVCDDWLEQRHLDPAVMVSYHVCKAHHLHLCCCGAKGNIQDILLKYLDNYLKSLDDDTFGNLMQHQFLHRYLKLHMLYLRTKVKQNVRL
ncbi:MAG: glycosyltransferase [Holosporaceae bacterium]|jgi:glycosyltransferase involved in cell wall biosynthesis|nr:glycosyltransferase [Holosporaceae bacterium]